MQSRVENIRYESVALLQRCFREICFKFNGIWPGSFEELEENFRLVYACFLFDSGESINGETSSTSSENVANVDLLELFTKIHYEVDRQVTISSTYNDDALPILSLIKQYASCANKDLHLWRRFFLYCYIENKVLLKSIIVSLFLD